MGLSLSRGGIVMLKTNKEPSRNCYHKMGSTIFVNSSSISIHLTIIYQSVGSIQSCLSTNMYIHTHILSMYPLFIIFMVTVLRDQLAMTHDIKFVPIHLATVCC